MSLTTKIKNTDIEVLRGLAVFFVIIQHFGVAFSWRPVHAYQIIFEYTGLQVYVDLFFCISGFVISKSLLPQIESALSAGTLSVVNTLKAFYIRRAYRLLPNGLFWAGVLVLLAAIFNRHGAFGNFKSTFQQFISVSTYTYNILSPHLGGPDTPATMGYYWSLSLEEQFYFLFPLFIVFIKSYRNRSIILLLIIIILFPVSLYYRLPFNLKIDPILWGVLIYFLSRNRDIYNSVEPVFLNRKLNAPVFIGFIFLLLTCAPVALSKIPIMVGVTSILSAILVFIASYDRKYYIKEGLILNITLWFGSRSYGLYIIHMPSIYIAQELYATYLDYRGYPLQIYNPIVMTVICIILIGAFTEMSYRLIEKPWRERGAELSKRVSRTAPESTI